MSEQYVPIQILPNRYKKGITTLLKSYFFILKM